MRKTQFQNFINDWWLCLKYQYPCQFHKQIYIVPLAVRRLLLKVPNVRKPLYSQTGFCSSWYVSSLHGFKAIRPSVSQSLGLSVRLSVSISKIRSFGLTAMNERSNVLTNERTSLLWWLLIDLNFFGMSVIWLAACHFSKLLYLLFL